MLFPERWFFCALCFAVLLDKLDWIDRKFQLKTIKTAKCLSAWSFKNYAWFCFCCFSVFNTTSGMHWALKKGEQTKWLRNFRLELEKWSFGWNFSRIFLEFRIMTQKSMLSKVNESSENLLPRLINFYEWLMVALVVLRDFLLIMDPQRH